MANQSVVSVVALEIAPGKESEFLSLTGKLQALVRRKGYGTNQLLRDGSHPRRYYDIRIWRSAEAAAHAEADGDVEELRRQLGRNLQSTPLVDVAWAVEIGLAAAGPWQERRVAGDRRAPNDRRVENIDQNGSDRRQGFDRRVGPRRTGEDPQPDIVAAATIARDRAHAAYSSFKVGAAIETTDGRIITGCNVENATYGLTMCAERIAIFKAVSDGHRSFKRIAIVADTDRPASPCGGCRQVLWEFAGDIEVILADLRGIRARHQLKDLLPHPFDVLFLE
ncbi:MAG: cytidine deaminase [Acidobacteria bacterium]|nr:cytidine deaminase [Acidobacteriota bacterium]